MKKKIAILLASAACMLLSVPAFAEGSRELVQNGGNRPYLEWYDGQTLGIQRHNTMNIFARSGEKILLGSSIYKSFDKKDIVITTPAGETVVLDVLEDGTGYINTCEKEANGPYTENGGYTPLTYEVKQTGIYKVQFHSTAPALNDDPVAVLAGNDFTGYQKKAVAAFDATVIDAEGNEIKGRGFFDFLCLNSGDVRNATQGVFSDVYILTNDGYEYKISLNGMNPYGFILFANNRGFIDPLSNTSLYKTIGSTNNTMPQSDIFGNIKILMPSGENTKTNITHKIFLNKPSEDLPESIPTTAELPSDVTDVTFIGVEEGVAATGKGGLFTVELSKDATYTIYLDIDNDGTFDGERDIQLANAGVKGKNTIYWNGLDKNGDVVAPGTVGVKAMAKGGEYHFPLLDAELMSKGLKVELLNAPRMYEGFDPFTVYYDDTDYTTAEGIVVNIRNKVLLDKGVATYTNKFDEQYLINPAEALSGISSKNGVLAYGDPNYRNKPENYYGDKKGFDFWTYYAGNDITSSLEVINTEKSKIALSGNVFYDKNTNATFDLTENGLEKITVYIKDSNGNTLAEVTTDNVGNYNAVVDETADDNYVISAGAVPAGYKPTTKSAGITVSKKQQGIIYVPDIGYNYNIDVTVSINADKTEYKKGGAAIFTVTAKNNTSIAANSVVVNAVLPQGAEFVEVVNADNHVYDAETGVWEVDTLAENETKTMQIRAVLAESGEFDFPSNISAEGDLYKDDAFKNNFDDTSYIVSDIPELKNDYAYIYGRSNTKMEPNDNILRGEVAAVIYRLMKQNDPNGTPNGYSYDVSATPCFADLNGRWDRSAVEYLVYQGMYTANQYKGIEPICPVTRGEAFKAVCLGLGFTTETDLSVEDYAQILVDNGYVVGDGSGNLNLDKTITRAEFCVIYNAITGRNSDDYLLTDVNGNEVTQATYGFTDFDSSDWYYRTLIKATSSYTNGAIDMSIRDQRNKLDDYQN